MKQQKLTRADIRKNVFKSNQQFILNTGILTENDYNNLWLDAGMTFLSEIYPPNDKRYSEYYHKFKSQRGFWKWWLKKWQDWEAIVVKEAYEFEIIITNEVYFDSMLPIIHSGYVEDNFFHFVKRLQYVL